MFSVDYWEERSSEESSCHTDWVCQYDHLRPYVKPFLLRPRSNALVLGSGTSTFPEEIYDG